MSARTLYEVGADLEALDALLEELGGDITAPEAEAAVSQWLDELGAEREQKLDRYAYYIADLEARADAKRAERERLQERIRVEENRAKYLKEKLKLHLLARGEKKVETALHRFTVANNGGKVPVHLLVPPEALPEEYRREKLVISADTDAIRAALDAGAPLDFATLGERGCNLRIS